MLDYIIVGSGLAGIAFAETVLGQEKTIVVFDNDSQNSSKVAAGLYNPVILKRFSSVWKAQEQLDEMNNFYNKLQKKRGCQAAISISILRKFFSIEEQNNWFSASDKPNVGAFLSQTLVHKKYSGIDAPFGYGKVLQTGYVNTELLLNQYRVCLAADELFCNEKFEYTNLVIDSDFVQYKEYKAKHIVFAEGFGVHDNPYFNQLPVDGTKGELVVIKATHLNLDVVVNTSVFVLPLGNDLFKVGATYNWKDKTNSPTLEGKNELLARIKEIIQCPFEVVSHFAGIRPTVRDRKPLVGTHAIHKSVHILNGLGTRGVMLAPSMAKALFEHIEYKIALDTEIDIKRFTKVSYQTKSS